MKVMVVGGGGREHTIVKKIKENKDVTELYALPGNGGIAQDAVCVDIGAKDIDGIVAFAKEKAIDFAVVALAYRYVLDDGVITDARMTLGAVAPVPMRRKKAEAYLIGRKPSGETALGAAKLALEGALPLSGNAYKIDVAETLVRRSLDWSGKDE